MYVYWLSRLTHLYLSSMAFVSVSGIHTNRGRHPTVKVVIQWFSAKMDQMLIAVVKTLLVVLKVDYL